MVPRFALALPLFFITFLVCLCQAVSVPNLVQNQNDHRSLYLRDAALNTTTATSNSTTPTPIGPISIEPTSIRPDGSTFEIRLRFSYAMARHDFVIVSLGAATQLAHRFRENGNVPVPKEDDPYSYRPLTEYEFWMASSKSHALRWGLLKTISQTVNHFMMNHEYYSEYSMEVVDDRHGPIAVGGITTQEGDNESSGGIFKITRSEKGA